MTLSERLAKTGQTPKAFAAAAGVSFQTLYRYLDGSRTPRPKMQRRIAELTGGDVQPNDWVSVPGVSA